jgi:hypothetical protein
MDIYIQSRFIHNVEVVRGLERTRLEWQQAADGESLLNLETNVGLLLADVTTAIGLTSEEKVLVLGAELLDELQDTLLPVPVDNGNQ